MTRFTMKPDVFTLQTHGGFARAGRVAPVVCLGLLLQVGFAHAGMDGGVHLLTPPPVVAVVPTTVALAPVQPGQAAADPNLIPQRNVFDPKRTPWTVPVPPPPPVPEPPPPPPISEADVMIQGVIVTDTMRKAIVALSSKFLTPFQTSPDKSSRPYRIVTVGDVLGGYRIVSIDPKEVVFEQAGARSTLPFNIAKGRPATGATVSPPEQMAIMVPVAQPTMSDGSAAVAAAPPAAPMDAAAVGAAVASAAPQPGGDPSITGGSDPNKPAGQPEQPKQGMTLLEAIEFARRTQTQPVANPFTNSQVNR